MRRIYSSLVALICLLSVGSLFAQVTNPTVSDVAPCVGDAVTVTWDPGSGGGGPYFITVSTSAYGGTDVTSGTQPSSSFIFNTNVASATYYVTVTGLDNIATNFSLITVDTPPTIPTGFTIDGDVKSLVCANVAFDLATTGGNTGTNGTIEWYANDEITALNSGDPYNVAAGIAVATTYKVRFEDAVCATNTAFLAVSVDVYAAPTAAATNVALDGTNYTGAVCPGTYLVSAVGGDAGDNPDTDTLFFTDAGFSAALTNPFTLASGANQDIYVRYVDGCAVAADQDGGPFNIAANTSSIDAGDLTPSAPSPVCIGDMITVTTDGSETVGTSGVYQYSTDGGTSWTNTTTGGADNFHAVTVNSDTSVMIRISDACGVTAGVTELITVNTNSTAPTSVTTSATSVCSGDNVTYTAVGGVLGTNGFYEYQINGGGWVANGISSSLTIPITVPTTVDFRITDDCITTGSASSVAVGIATNSDVTGFTVTASSNAICGDQSVTWTANVVTLGDGATVEFATDAGFTTVVQNTTSTTYTATVTTSMTVYARVVGGCNDVSATTDNDAVVHTVANDITGFDLYSSDTVICGDQNITWTVTIAQLGDGAVYEFATDAGFTSIVQNTTSNTYTQLVNADITIYARVSGGCNDVSATDDMMAIDHTTASDVTGLAIADDQGGVVCNTTSTTFTVSNATLGAGATIHFASDAAFTNTIQNTTSNTVTFNVTMDTTVYARVEGGCNDLSATVVNAPIDYQDGGVGVTTVTTDVDPATTVCNGTDVTFTTDGTLGDGATFEYQVNAGGWVATGNAGTDNFVLINITVATTVDFRIQGSCDAAVNAAMASKTINVYPGIPSITSLTIDKDDICADAGEVVNLKAFASAAVNAPYKFDFHIFNPLNNTYSTTPFKSSLEDSVNVSPTKSTTYAVRLTGCDDTSAFVARLLTVKDTAQAPMSVTANPANPCPGTTVSLTVNGGAPGFDGQAVWYSGSDSLGIGNPFFLTIGTADTTVMVRYESDCNTTAFSTPLTIEVVNEDDITVSNAAVCSGVDLSLIAFATPTGGTFSGTGVSGTTFNMVNTTMANVDYTVTYTKTFNGGACSYSKDFTVTVYPQPVLTIDSYQDVSGASCGAADGSITVSTLPAGTYDYYLNGGLDGTSAVGYTYSGLTGTSDYDVQAINVTTTCVSNEETQTITNPIGISVITVETDVTCSNGADGSVTFNVSGGVSPYEYSIDGGITYQTGNSFSGLAPGTYNYSVVDDNGCTNDATFTINNQAAINVQLTDFVNLTCFEDMSGELNNVQAVGGGAGPYQYKLDSVYTTYTAATSEPVSFDMLPAWAYKISVKDNLGCVKEFTFPLEQPEKLISNSTSLLETDGTYTITVTANGGTGDYIYSIEGGDFQLSNEFEGLTEGTYEVTVEDENGCQFVETVLITGIYDLSTTEFAVYPNPFRDEIHLTNANEFTVVLVDQLGRVLNVPTERNGEEMIINTSSLAQGMYFINITDGADMKTIKVIKK